MDTMIQSYMEETEDMLQKAEECIIRLEMEYSSVDVNELFRIAHTIKGSSHMVGYEDIGNLMHRIEDMLDCARNGSIVFNQSIVELCFDGLDAVKKMLQAKDESGSQVNMSEHNEDALRISERIEGFIRSNKRKNKKKATSQEEEGLVSTLLNKEPKGRNKYYITFVLDEDAPMISPILLIILKSIEDIGTLLYSSVSDDYFVEAANDTELKTFDIILCTDAEEGELYTYFALFYVMKINIINLNRSLHEMNDYCFNEVDISPYVIVMKAIMKLYQYIFNQSSEFEIHNEEGYCLEKLQKEAIEALKRIKKKDKSEEYIKNLNKLFGFILKAIDDKGKISEKTRMNSQGQLIKIIEGLYQEVKGKHIVRTIKPQKDRFMKQLKNFIGMVNRSSTLILLVDISNLDILHEYEIKDIIELKNDLLNQGIELALIAEGPRVRRIINIFDSIKPIFDFRLYKSELEAIFGIFKTVDSFHRIMNRIEDLEREQ